MEVYSKCDLRTVKNPPENYLLKLIIATHDRLPVRPHHHHHYHHHIFIKIAVYHPAAGDKGKMKKKKNENVLRELINYQR